VRATGRFAGLVLALSLTVAVSTCSREADGERPWSVQLHVHGSFSEMTGSIDSHTFEAAELGLDVLWWSDHDFRITSYRQPNRFSFDAYEEPLAPDERWHVSDRTGVKRVFPKEDPARAAGGAKTSTRLTHEGAGSLHVSAAAPKGSTAATRLMVSPAASRDGFRRPLAAGVKLRLAIWPGPSVAGGRALIELGLSEHAPREGLGLEPYYLRYFAAEGGVQPYREGATYHVPLTLRAEEWNVVELPVSAHVLEGFPFIVGEDNSLNRISLGAEVPPGAKAEVYFDDLRIEQSRAGEAMFARQREVVNAVARARPAPIQHQGVEISYASAHLNEFSLETTLLDYDAVATRVADELGADAPYAEVEPFVTRLAVDEVHARGGLVSYNHMFGTGMAGAEKTGRRRDVLAQLLEARVFGCDLLEVGYRDRGGHSLEDHLWVWDQLAAAGLFPVGVGVSDSHGGPSGRWKSSPNNFVSWIYADGPEKAELLAGMRAGRVFFGDLVRFDGTLDLRTAKGARMGQVVVTDRERVELLTHITGLAGDETVTLVESGVRTQQLEVRASDFEDRRTIELAADGGTSVRVEVRGPRGGPRAFSNPIHFVREAPEGIAPERLFAR
jgi:hypothetical protein